MISRLKSRNARLIDLDLTKMTITAGGRLYNIPFTPPLSNFEETRERLIKMDQESLTGLGRSSITIKEYRPPKSPIHIVTFISCFLTFVLLSRRENTLPGSIPYETVFKHMPKFASFVASIQPLVLYPMLAIHITEAFFMSRKLEKHSVPLLGTIWWAWIISTFIEGVGAFQRYVWEILCVGTNADFSMELMSLWLKKKRNRRIESSELLNSSACRQSATQSPKDDNFFTGLDIQ